MSWTVIIEKRTGRCVLARRRETVVGLECVFSPVSHTYMWLAAANLPYQGFRERPWEFVLAGDIFVSQNPILSDSERQRYENNHRRALMLISLSRAVARHRRLTGTQIEGQDEVYAAKLAESRQVLNSPSPELTVFTAAEFPFLAQYAEFHNLSIVQAARMVALKASQRRSALLASEEQRMTFQKRILEALPVDFPQLENEILAYERTY